jgi:large subunit ribosomal protein L32
MSGNPPKRKKSRARSRAHTAGAWRLDRSARSLCPNCGAVKQPHIVCSNCGWYGGRQVIDVD